LDKQKRILAIHDISCFGRCSLTVVLPIISAVGVETVILPTAILSTHTGGFSGYTYRDLTGDISPICDHWESLDIQFDAVYSGFLGSYEQIDVVCEIFDKQKKNGSLILVDPVMADNGKLYSIFDDSFPLGMRKLCKKADIIVPNITEATLLLGYEYKDGPYTKAYIESILLKLASLGPNKVVLTGVYFDNNQLGAASYDVSTDRIEYAFQNRIEGYYHGTGDVFGSALLASIINGKSISNASKIAVKYTADSILRTHQASTDIRFGVNFESGIEDLIRACKKTDN
jgi:pyridoxine kinase